MADNVGRTIRKGKRLRAHVDYEGMSVSYGRVKLGVPSGFKEMLESVTKEILREQPKNIPGFLAAYFEKLSENQKTGCPLQTLVTERIVEVNPQPMVVESSMQADEIRPETAAAAGQTETVEAETAGAQTEPAEAPETNETAVQSEQVEACPEKTENCAKRHCSDTAINSRDRQSDGKCDSVKCKSASATAGTDTDFVPLNADKSHTSVSSLSQIKDLKLINCEVILKKSAEDLACELEDTENAATEQQAVDQESQQQPKDDASEEALVVTQEVQILSLEQQANEIEYVDDADADEEMDAGSPEEPAPEASQRKQSNAQAEPDHYCPDEEEPIDEALDIRASTLEAAVGEPCLEQQAEIEYEDDEAEPLAEDAQPAAAEEAPEVKSAAAEEAPEAKSADAEQSEPQSQEQPAEQPEENTDDASPNEDDKPADDPASDPAAEEKPAEEEPEVIEPTEEETHDGINDA